MLVIFHLVAFLVNEYFTPETRNAINTKQKIGLGVNKYIRRKKFSLYTEMDCGTTNLHYCDECGERKRELFFTYQVIKKETVKKSLISLNDLEDGVYKPVEIIEDEKMRVLKIEDEKGEFHFIDQKRYSLNKDAVYNIHVYYENKKEAKEVDLLNVLESFSCERGQVIKYKWKIFNY